MSRKSRTATSMRLWISSDGEPLGGDDGGVEPGALQLGREAGGVRVAR
ncbi:hypothetical protein O0235_06265 [Tepidiforma flava]|uniref:Uncharacterized protein n=1 Tax=Tepidiforma flava TaxID=3004094 RepID=A0ABY7MEW2_9CHLR|nr:hypothetical protein [Tepidiforma flava]WBL37593.1 hypothetical protein O0235_06265 [Tepidiforma flava]